MRRVRVPRISQQPNLLALPHIIPYVDRRTIPTSSLVIDHSGMHVVTVEDNRKAHFVSVVIGRDMGTQVEILRGIQSSDTLVASPSDLLHDGQEVEVR